MNIKKFWAENKLKPLLLGTALFAAALSLYRGPRTVVRPMTADSPAERYVAEFHDATFSEVLAESAPDGSGKIVDRNLSWLPMGFTSGCHRLRYAPNVGWSRKIVTARESDPGSGRSFSWGWSRDSRAIFISGSHSGLDCRGVERGELRVIYTLADHTAWGVPQ